MKKLLKIILPIVIAAALGTTGFIIFQDNTEYYVDSNYFQSTIEYKGEVDLTGLTIIETEKDEVVAEHQVDSSMVVSCDSTNSVGEKTLVLQYDKEQFIVNFVVMYKVQFEVEGNIIASQFVYKASEITVPENPYLEGYEFTGWSPAVQNVINDNALYKATFSDEPASVPNLGTYSATYGDTLESIKLPKNQYGSWEFVDDVTTLVGNAGTHEFEVKFVPVNSELKVLTDVVTVNVSKKVLEFKNVVTTFNYDGNEHLPTYELDAEVNVTVMGTAGVEVGSYFVIYVINDANYEGSWQGNFSIVATEITISFEQEVYEITLGDALPEFKYIVTGIEDPSVLDLKVNIPNVNHAGEYEITITVGNASYKNVKINKAKLIVDKVSLGVGLPKLTSTAIYGNKLSSVTFEDNNPNGYWTWGNPDYVFDKVGTIEVNLVFTPYSSFDYEVEIKTINLNVSKRELSIVIEETEFVYNGNSLSVIYKVFDDEVQMENVKVSGEIFETNAGIYPVELVVDEENYKGSASANLIIKKAIPKDSNGNDISFDYTFDVVIGSRLNMIENMPEGFEWVVPTIELTTYGLGQEFEVKYVPEDIDNYEVLYGKFIVNVFKKDGSIIVSESYEFTYGDEVELNAKFPHTSSEPIYKYFVNDQEVENITNVGKYLVQITLPETEQYNEFVVSTEVTIVAKAVKVAWDFNESYIFSNALLNTPIASFTNVENNYVKLQVVSYNDKDVEVEFKNAGSYYFVAQVSEYTNYVFTNTELEDIEIQKALISLEEVKWNYAGAFVYDGLEHKVEVVNFDQVLTPVYEENVKVEAGKYTASVSFTYDEANYILEGEVSDLEWEITASAVVVEWDYEELYVFTGSNLELPKATINGGSIELIVTVEGGNEFRNAGTYTFVANLEGSNYTLSNVKLKDIIVEKAELEVEWTYAESYKYNGSVLVSPTANVIDLLNAKVELNVVTKSGSEFKNAGTYLFAASFADSYADKDNYVLVNTDSEEVTVAKANFDLTGMYWDYSTPFIYNGLEQSVKLKNVADGIVPIYENNEYTNAGNYVATVTFGYDVINYNEPEFGSLSWAINPYEVEVAWVAEEVYIYTGANLKAPTASYVNIAGEELALVVVEANGKVFKEADDYRFVASIADAEIANNYKLLNNTIEVSISKSTVAIGRLNAVYGDTLSDVVLPTSEYGVWSFVDELTTLVGEAGNNKFAVHFESTSGNYDSFETEVTIVVSKKLVTITVVENEFVYDGTDKTIEVEVVDGSKVLNVNVLGNVSKKNASSTNATLTIDDKNYYAEAVQSSLVIARADAVITNSLETDNSDYNGEEIDLTSYFTLNHSEVSLNFDITVARAVASIKDAGKYTIVVSAAQSLNYNAAQITVEYTVNKINPVITYTAPEAGYTYSNTVITLDKYVKHTNTDADATVSYEYFLLVEDTYMVAREIKEAGTYKVIITVESTANYNTVFQEVQVVVEKGHLNLGDLKEIETIYGRQLKEFEFAAVEGGSWSWVNPEDYVGNVGENKHQAVFTPTNDSMSIEYKEVTFVVTPRPITITLGNTKFAYTGEAHTVSYTLSETPEGVTVEVTGTITATDYVLGGYAFRLDIVGNENYTGYVEGVLIIEQISSGITEPVLNAIYGQTLADIELPENELGTWAFKTSLTTSVGVVGGNTKVSIEFIPYDTNYKTESFDVILNVSKADYLPTVIPTELNAVYGDYLGKVVLPNSKDGDENGTWTWEDNTVKVGNAGVQKHMAIFTHDDSDNYNSYSVEVTINVAKADAVISENLPDKLVYTGGELIKEYFALNHSEAELQFTVTGKDTSVVNAGKYNVIVSVAETANYNGATLNIGILEVAKATPNVNFNKVYTYTWGTTLSDADLDKGFTWDNKVKLDSNYSINQYTFAATYTPEDTDNYETLYGDLTVNVIKVVGSITVADNQQFTYGDEINLGATTNNIDGEIITMEVTGNNGETELVDATTYTVVLSVKESDHYTSASVTITVVIEQQKLAVEEINEYQYGVTLNSMTRTNEIGTITYSLTEPTGISPIAESDELLGVAGAKVIAYMIFTPSADFAKNYASYYKEVEITITKKVVEFEIIDSTFTYDTNSHSVQFDLIGLLPGDENVKSQVTGNVSIINVKDSQSVTLVLNTENYIGKKEVNLTVEKAIPVTNFEGHEGFTVYYNTQLANIDLVNGYEFNVNQTLTTIGTFEFDATYTPSDLDNYVVVPGKYTINVIKLVTDITVNDLSGKTYAPSITYSIQVNVTPGNTSTPEILVNGSEEYTIGNAGTYNVVITVGETDYYQSATLEYSFTIAKATPATNFNTNALKGVYGGGLPSLSDFNNEIGTYIWDDASLTFNSVGIVPVKAKFVPNDNYKDNYIEVAGSFNINVEQAKGKIELIGQPVFEYTGSVIQLNFKITSDSGVVPTVIVKVGDVVTELKEIGKYNVIVSIPSSTNYTEAEIEFEVEITKITLDFEGFSITLQENDVDQDNYNALLAGLNSFGVEGTFTYADSEIIKFKSGHDSKMYVVTKTLTFKPVDLTHYEIVYNIPYEINLYAVAHIGNKNYGTIEDAVSVAKSGDTIYVYAGTIETPMITTIYNDIKINSEITLVLPYDVNDNYGSTTAEISGPDHDDWNIEKNIFEREAKLVSTVIVAENVKIEIANGATLIVGGQLSAGQANAGGSCGHTGGLYARLLLSRNASIISNGIVRLFGYIEEETKNNDSYFEVASGEIYLPYIIRDFRGGTITSSIYNGGNPTFPFLEMEIRNTQTLTIFRFGCSVYGMANITAQNNYYPATLNFIGSNSTFFIELTEKDYSLAKFKYDKDTEVQKLDVYGGAKTNSMSISMTVTLNTSNYYFPFSWRFDISMNVNEEAGQKVANYNMNQRFELLPGSKLTIGKGVDLYIKELTIYSNWKDQMVSESATIGGLRYGYGRDYSGAIFINNGSVEADKIAGYVQNTVDGAKLKVNSSAAITTFKVNTIGDTDYIIYVHQNSKISKWDTISEKLQLDVYENGAPQNKMEFGVNTYFSKDGAWYSDDFSITYYTYNGKTNIIEYESQTIDGVAKDDLIEVERSGFIFKGWYYDQEYTRKVTTNVLGNTKLYAKWEAITYSIDYIEKTVEEGVVSNVNSGNDNNLYNEFNILSNTTFTKDSNELKLEGYRFAGYYLDAEFTKPISNMTGSVLFENIGNNTVVIYIKWIPKTISYKINFVSDSQQYGYSGSLIYENLEQINVSQFANPFVNTADTDLNYSMFFAGWGQDNCVLTTEQIVTLLNNTTPNEDLEVIITLTSIWASKVKLTVVCDYSSGITDTSVTTWYKPGSSTSAISFNDISGYYRIIETTDFVNGSKIESITSDTVVKAKYLKIIKININAPGSSIVGFNYDIGATVTSGYHSSDSALSGASSTSKEYKASGSSGNVFYVTEGSVIKMTTVDTTKIGTSYVYVAGSKQKKNYEFTVGSSDIIIKK